MFFFKSQTECYDWVETAKILMSQLTGEPIEILFPPVSELSVGSGKTHKGRDKQKPAAMPSPTPKSQQEVSKLIVHIIQLFFHPVQSIFLERYFSCFRLIYPT